VLERIGGQRWEDFIRDRILQPLGMERATTDEAGRLTFTRNEGATERLLARHGNIFGFADSEFFRIEFRRNAAGQVDALLSHQPTGTYLAERDAAPR
jgi:CubicO group peptidase (beta-lactamase class C family)